MLILGDVRKMWLFNQFPEILSMWSWFLLLKVQVHYILCKIIWQGTWGSRSYLFKPLHLYLVCESGQTRSVLMGLDWILFCEAGSPLVGRQWLIPICRDWEISGFATCCLVLGKSLNYFHFQVQAKPSLWGDLCPEHTLDTDAAP